MILYHNQMFFSHRKAMLDKIFKINQCNFPSHQYILRKHIVISIKTEKSPHLANIIFMIKHISKLRIKGNFLKAYPKKLLLASYLMLKDKCFFYSR